MLTESMASTTPPANASVLTTRSWFPLAFILAVFALYLAVNPSILADWRAFSFDDGSYSHAYLIPPIIAYLFWDTYRRGLIEWDRNLWVLLPLLLALYGVLVTRYAQNSLLERVLLPLPIFAALTMVFRMRLALLAPVAMLWFITPIWGVLVAPLQELSARAVETAMRATSIPTFVNGNFVQIPAGTFEIAEGCSGLRYVISALAIAFVYCHLYLTRWKSMLVFAVVAVLGSILTNWLRILLLVLIGHFSEMKSEIIRDHNMFGWYLFIPLMLMLSFLGRKLEADDVRFAKPRERRANSIGSRVVGTFLVVVSLAVVSELVLGTAEEGATRFYVDPLDIEALQPTPLVDWDPELPQPILYGSFTHSLDERLSSDHGTFHKFRYDGYRVTDAPDFYLNSLVPRGWRACGAADITGSTVKTQELCKGRQRARLEYFFRVGNETTTSKSQLRILRLKQALSLKSGSALYWRFTGNLVSVTP
ncbi:MAG: exosortase [Pseudomonadota bacterium]